MYVPFKPFIKDMYALLNVFKLAGKAVVRVEALFEHFPGLIHHRVSSLDSLVPRPSFVGPGNEGTSLGLLILVAACPLTYPIILFFS